MVDEPKQRRIKVLFLCTHNSCRSQMAEGWVHKLRSDVIEAHSAGTETRKLDPFTIRAMLEDGVNMHTYKSKHVSTLEDIEFDYVITVCDHAREVCPVFPGKTKILHVGFEDPSVLAENARSEKEALNYYRRVRDEIRKFIATLPKSLDRLVERQLGNGENSGNGGNIVGDDVPEEPAD